MIKRHQHFIEILKSLVSISTVSSNNLKYDCSNKKCVEVIANYLYDLNFEIDITKIPNSNEKFNLLACTKNHQIKSEGGLLLSGHTDTVPCDEFLWNYNPFKLIKKNNKLYGLGTTDMKGFFACIISLITIMNLKNIKKPLYILATADEETSMQGVKYFSQNTCIKPELSIIGEPTNLQIVQSHKGYICKKIQITTLSAHSSNPDQEKNSIEIMYEVIGVLMCFKNFLKKNLDLNFKVPYSTMNFGCIQGGDAPNKICASCILELDIRFISSFSIKKINFLLKKSLILVEKKWNIKIKLKDIYDGIPYYQFKNYDLLKKVKNTISKKSIFEDYCTEAPFLNSIFPTIILGPGCIKQAHQVNEFIDMKYIIPTHTIFSSLIHKFCF
ncbi:acetylornithine deacetylase [Buchnera aphidicola (Thelaxes californica)]|uniref:Acetylornithine deacetylase n=1 Tax=Buchnera aphidicola (Thelaxes californica) TaxID=1315998 RepID=A0A4D6Y9C7_9GAMM|nr:acetylornithine deacetylase [Buchnera aphidicola]QCI26596.1 acetylornithine deacetylase [Buchnera aphidicola (Thelaxes californica)]